MSQREGESKVMADSRAIVCQVDFGFSLAQITRMGSSSATIELALNETNSRGRK